MTSDDTVLSPDGPKREEKIIDVDPEESHGNFLIVIIGACLLIPVIALLCFFVYLQKKNKEKSINTATNRPRSTLRINSIIKKSTALRDAPLVDDEKKRVGSIIPNDDSKIENNITPEDTAYMAEQI